MIFQHDTPTNRLLNLAIASGAAGNLVEETVTGNPVAFETDIAKPLKGLLIPFTPVQAGSGDPSPDNVRPISGWTGLSIIRTGKNLFDKAYLSDPSSYKNDENYYLYTDAIYLAPNATYTITPSSTDQLETSAYYVLYINPSQTDPDYLVITNADVRYPVTSGKPKAITFTTGATGVIRFGTLTSSIPAFMAIDWQIEAGDTSTTYEPYTGTTIPVSWETEAGTVYGGTLDALTGVLTVEWVGITYTGAEGESWNVKSGVNFYIATPETFPRNTTELTLVCNAARSQSTLDDGACKISNTGNFNIQIGGLIGISTVASFKTWLTNNNVQIACKLPTPQTIQLDPVTLATLKGTNVLWTDTNGTNEITYMKKG